MRITNIVPYKNYVLIKVSNGEQYKISEDALFENAYKTEQIITDDDLEVLQRNQLLNTAYLRCLNRIAYKDRTKMEIVDFLYQEYELTYDEVNKIIEKFIKYGYIDDERYIKDYIEYSKSKYLGYHKMKDELISVKINSALIEKYLVYDYQREFEVACEYANNTVHKIRNKSYQQTQTTLRNRLAYRGFDFNVINDVLDDIEIPFDSHQESLLLEKEVDRALRRFKRKYTGYDLRLRVFNSVARKGYNFDKINGYLDKVEEEFE